LISGLLLILPLIKDQSTYFNIKFNTPLFNVLRWFPEFILIIPILSLIYNILSTLSDDFNTIYFNMLISILIHNETWGEP
jgi:hypothetical protein